MNPNTQTFLEKKKTRPIWQLIMIHQASEGIPKYYANWDANFWVVAPTPDAQYEITMAYIKQPTSLTDSSVSTTGTYLSNKYQDLLLYASLINAYRYLKGPWICYNTIKALIKQALQTYAIEQQGRRRRDEYQDRVIRTPLKSPFPSEY